MLFFILNEYSYERVNLTCDHSADNEEHQLKKKGIVVTARVHPGESNSSWMMKGLLEYITGNSQMAAVRRSGDIRLSVGQLWNVFLADMTRLLRNHFYSFIELFQIMSFVVYIMYW